MVVISARNQKERVHREGNGQGKLQRKVNFELSPKGQLGFRQGASNKGILDDGQIHILYIYMPNNLRYI